MSLADYQQQVDDHLQTYTKPYWSVLSNFAQLVEEVGELGRILNHTAGDKVKKTSEAADDMEGEMGDVLFSLICLANDQSIDLDKAIQKSINKSMTRDKDRFEKKPADA